MDLQGPDFSDSRDPIFSDSRDPNRVPTTPLKTVAIDVIVFEIQLNKLEVAKRLKRCKGGTTFVAVFKAAEIPSVLKNF